MKGGEFFGGTHLKRDKLPPIFYSEVNKAALVLFIAYQDEIL